MKQYGKFHRGFTALIDNKVSDIDFTCCELSDQNIIAIVDALSENTITRTINLSGNALTPKSIVLLEQNVLREGRVNIITDDQNLKFLCELSMRRFRSGALIESIADHELALIHAGIQALKDNGLIDLTFTPENKSARVNVGIAEIDALCEALATNTSVISLGIENICLDSDDVLKLCDALRKNTTVKSLTLNCTGLGAESVSHLRALIAERPLTINVIENQSRLEGVRHLIATKRDELTSYSAEDTGTGYYVNVRISSPEPVLDVENASVAALTKRGFLGGSVGKSPGADDDDLPPAISPRAGE